MAITTRYFSTTSAGAADGTSWADRAALFSAGNWSTVITGFDFTSDSLKCLIGPGSYTCSQQLQTSVFTVVAPSVNNPIFLHACDSSGVTWTPTDPDWMSAQPVWDTSTMPDVSNTGTSPAVNLTTAHLRGLKISSSTSTSSVVSNFASMDWCYLVNSRSNTSAIVLSGSGTITNCCLAATGTAYSAVSSNAGATNDNVRMEGNLSASSGNRHGWTTGNNAFYPFSFCTVVNNIGYGFGHTSTGTGGRVGLYRCTAVNNSDGVYQAGTATSITCVANCILANSSAYGVNVAGTGRMSVAGCRLRNNTSGDFNGMSNYPSDLGNETSAGTDSAEFVDPTNGDYRIKNSSSIWGKGYGAGDQAATASGSSASVSAYCY